MTAALAILADARRHRVAITRTPDGRLKLDAASPPPQDFIEAASRHKDALLKALAPALLPFDPVAWHRAFRLAPAPRDPDAWLRDGFYHLRARAQTPVHPRQTILEIAP